MVRRVLRGLDGHSPISAPRSRTPETTIAYRNQARVSAPQRERRCVLDKKKSFTIEIDSPASRPFLVGKWKLIGRVNCLVKYASGSNYVRIGSAGKTWIVHLAVGQTPPDPGEIILLECKVDIVGENYRMKAISWRRLPETGRAGIPSGAPEGKCARPFYDSDSGEDCDGPFDHEIDMEDEIPF